MTIDVPLDHFNPDDLRTLPVVFGVLPASGVRKGMFVTATGGPGTSGVLLADSYSAGFDPSKELTPITRVGESTACFVDSTFTSSTNTPPC